MTNEILEKNLVTGVFLREQKTRFLCDVLVENREVECYVAASCKLSRFVDLVGKEVVVQLRDNQKSRTKYSLYAAKIESNYVLLNLSEVNRVVENQLHRKIFSFLGERETICREKVIEGYKTDLYIEDTKTLIEVKTILSLDGKEGKFPSMATSRAEQQLAKLSLLLDKGYKVSYIIVALNPNVSSIRVDENYGRYYKLFLKCIQKGMQCSALKMRMKRLKPEICGELQIYY